MSKYSFERLEPKRFEELAQALLEKLRSGGNLVQFGDGADGAREATWEQPANHPDYVRPKGAATDISKLWVFQVKYHDIGLRGWEGARKDVVSDLDKELKKVVETYNLGCHHYVLITNVPFSGRRYVGTRDEVEIVEKKWTDKIPEIEVWDAADLSRMLDADPGTRTTYLDAILPGDVLRAIIQNIDKETDMRSSTFRSYLRSIVQSERDAKAEEAGDESGLALDKAFVDLELELVPEGHKDDAVEAWLAALEKYRNEDDAEKRSPHASTETRTPASLALLRVPSKSFLVKGGPGVGKSTITQFVTLYHAARMVAPELARALAERLKLRDVRSAAELDANCQLRFPLRVELRRYATWIREQKDIQEDTFLARYIASLVNRATSSSLDMEDIFELSRNNAVLLVLDGLDEVPDHGTREIIFQELAIFHNRCSDPGVDLQTILSTRPQGYRGEFDGFNPLSWRILKLSRSDFDDYSQRWIAERIANLDERKDAENRVEEGMRSHAVRQLAGTLLQATVMLTIARKKQPIPHARHKLFQKYVDVIFDREETKDTVCAHREALLRLHELVGYELIRRMGSPDENPTLRGDDFSKCVQTVFCDYGPLELDGKTCGQTRETITTLAKDRLCLIAGKGDEQDDFDFVIQPFREYFAASYLARHEHADSDMVYASLTARGHIWSNVLQFYAAFQSPATQMNWITDSESTEHSDVVELIRRRRVLLRLLPEFEQLKTKYMDRAFRSLFFPDTIWSWGERQVIAPLLFAFAGKSAFGRLKTALNTSSVTPLRDVAGHLSLLAQQARPENEIELIELIKRVGTAAEVRSIIRRIILQYDLPLRWWSNSLAEDSAIQIDWISFYPRVRSQQLSRFTAAMEEHELLDLLVLAHGPIDIFGSEVIDGTWIGQMISFLDASVFGEIDTGVALLLAPFAVDRSAQDVSDWIRQLEASGAIVAPYLASLLRAISRPMETECYDYANEKYQELINIMALLHS